MTTTAIVDTLYLVPHDTLSISRPDTLVALLQQTPRTPTDWLLAILPSALSLALFVAVLWGWRVAHRSAIAAQHFAHQNAIKAQNKQFHDAAAHEAARIVAAELMQFRVWLIEISGYLSNVYSGNQFEEHFQLLLSKELDSDSSTRWSIIIMSHQYTLWQIMPDLEEQMEALMARSNALMRKAIDSIQFGKGTLTDRSILAGEASDEASELSDHVDNLRARLLVAANNFVFPDSLVTQDTKKELSE
jgi:hypothetical protein